MLLGLKNAPSTFQLMMDVILSTVSCQLVLVCLYDVIIFFRSVEEHLDLVQTVLGPFSRTSISMRLNKCLFLEDRINYLSHVIQAWRPGMSTKASDSTCGLQHFTDVTELRSFTSLCNVI